MMNTARCRIRRFKPEDMQDFISYRNDMEWMRYQMFKGLTQEEYERALLKAALPEEGIQLAVAENQADKLIGDLYLRRDKNSFWIGYTIHPAYAGNGLMREAVSGFVQILLQCPGCEEVLAGVAKENFRSKNLLEKTGFQWAYYDEEAQEDIYKFKKA